MVRGCLNCKYLVGSTFLLLLICRDSEFEEPHHKMVYQGRIVIISLLLSVE